MAGSSSNKDSLKAMDGLRTLKRELASIVLWVMERLQLLIPRQQKILWQSSRGSLIPKVTCRTKFLTVMRRGFSG